MYNPKLFSLNRQQLENQYRENIACLRILDWLAFYVVELCMKQESKNKRSIVYLEI